MPEHTESARGAEATSSGTTMSISYETICLDTIMGDSHGTHSALTVAERTTGFLQLGKLERRCAADATAETIELIERQAGRFLTITTDNGSEFHSYERIEEASGVEFYFATPHHSWERGTNENTNGLIRQYLPNRKSMARITDRPRDRRGQAQLTT